MAILNRNAVTPTPGSPNPLPETSQVPSNSIFTAIDPMGTKTAFSKYVEGYPMTVNYYGQLLGDYNTVENFDPTSPDLTQPLFKVTGLIIQLTNPIDSSYNNNDGIVRVTGAAIFPLGLIPNVGDLFIARVENGDDGVFQLTTVNRKTHRKDTLYEADFGLLYYLSTDATVLPKLDARVNDEYYFNKDTNFFNRDALITPKMKEATDQLNAIVRASQRFYFSTFYQRRTGGLYLPNSRGRFYDDNLIQFIAKTVDFSNADFYRVTMPETSFDSVFDNLSIFDMIQTRNKELVHLLAKNWKFFSAWNVGGDARYGALRFSGVDFITMPVTGPIEDVVSATTSPYETDPPPSYNPLMRLRDGLEVNTFPELFEPSSYLVSGAFYQKFLSLPSTLSYFEYVLFKFISREAVSKIDLAVLCRDWTQWTPLQQYYLLPVMWFMAKNT